MKKSNLLILLFSTLFFIIFYGCKKNDPGVAPTVTTTAITDLTATGGGKVTDNGGNAITAKGICFSTKENPTTADHPTNDGKGPEAFISSLIGLAEKTTYYVKAYATNSEGTSYGKQVQFTTLASPTIPTVTTTVITDITAMGGGNVTANGGKAVTARGICYGTTANPTIDNNPTTDGTGTGEFHQCVS